MPCCNGPRRRPGRLARSSGIASQCRDAPGQTQEARLVLDYLERYAQSHRSGSGHAAFEIARYRTLTRWRVSWAETPSRDAVAGLRQLYHQALEGRDLYVGCGLAVELAEMLAAMEEFEEADTLFFHTVKAAAVAGLYQVSLEGRPGSDMLLRRAYRDVLPFVGSLRSPNVASAIR